MVLVSVVVIIAIILTHPIRPSLATPAPHWDYTDPFHWSTIDPSYHLCGDGLSQSPVNINTNTVVDYSSPFIQFRSQLSSSPSLIHTGNTLQLTNNYNNDENNNHRSFPLAGVDFNSRLSHFSSLSFDFIQLHFHSPSEHTVDDVRHDMEIHLVHKNHFNETIVIALFMQVPNIDDSNDRQFESRDKEIFHHYDQNNFEVGHNLFLDELEWFNSQNTNSNDNPQQSPTLRGESRKYSTNKIISLTSLLPVKLDYWHYSGSLTTPPCKEGIEWFILTTAVTISQSQLKQFRDSFSSNFRPIQAINGRIISRSPGEIFYAEPRVTRNYSMKISLSILLLIFIISLTGSVGLIVGIFIARRTRIFYSCLPLLKRRETRIRSNADDDEEKLPLNYREQIV